jgi:ribosomal-protein-alanine N-acetyltransferase
MDQNDVQGYKIRRMVPSDIPDVSQLEKYIFRDPWPRTAYIQELYFNPNARYFVLEILTEEGNHPGGWLLPLRRPLKIQGYVGMRVEQKEGHVSTLAVHPSWRGRGFGELLLIKVIRQALDMGAERITLEVRVSNHIARQLYKKYGFQEIQRLSNYYRNGETALLMGVDVGESAYQTQLDAFHQAIIEEIRAALHGGEYGNKEEV